MFEVSVMKSYREKSFEDLIEEHLLANGWQNVAREAYDKSLALFPGVVLQFIRETHPKQWAKLEKLHGEKTGEVVLNDLGRMLDRLGCLTVIRHGFKCYGHLIRMAFFRPAHGLNPEAAALYAANRLGLTRQLQYSERNANALDLAFSVNGIPVATVELKNPMTGSSADDAIRQYMRDRDPRELIFEFKRRTLVHFAADTEKVFMTTRLAGSATTFLPFNRGVNGGAGNPPCADAAKHRTSYARGTIRSSMASW